MSIYCSEVVQLTYKVHVTDNHVQQSEAGRTSVCHGNSLSSLPFGYHPYALVHTAFFLNSAEDFRANRAAETTTIR